MTKKLLNNPIDVSEDYAGNENEYFIPSRVESFDPATGEGKVEWQLHRYVMDWYFNKIDKHLAPQSEHAASFQDYDVHPVCDFSITFVSERTIRLRMKTTTGPQRSESTLMINDEVAETNHPWPSQPSGDEIIYSTNGGKTAINTRTFSIKLYNAEGKLLTSTHTMQELEAMHTKSTPFSFVRKASDYTRNIAASFTLAPDEKIYGCGESFTSLNKRGQKVVLFSVDAQSSASPQMYKPIPFFFSNRGYGMFVHSSAPITMDFGQAQAGTSTIFSGDDYLDIFFFIGNPQEILTEYTRLTGRSPLPPLWSFGLWMGCFSYRSEKEVEEVAAGMRENNFPSDVIHIDAGWFKKGINCDFEFCEDNFPEPEKMISNLREKGFRTSVWQLPYFTPRNPIYKEVVDKKLFIKNGKGEIPTEDAILDLTNEDAVRWYEQKLEALLKMGVSAIKVDFGEATPVNGVYDSGKTGWYEHNLYPLRYNKLVSDLTEKVRNERIIWARGAWAGSQKYPVHWGGDAEVSDAGMAGSLRGGLSFGLSGFSFWSHDIGGFSGSPVEELYGRWAFFGLLSSHSRVHGFPPREPWHYSEEFQNGFRKISQLRYKLMPYIYAQAAEASSKGLPLMKALLLNYPDDPTAWTIEDQYLLGNDIIVAPIFEADTTSRKVYLPEGKWINHENKEVYDGGKRHTITAGEWKGIILYRGGALIPVAEPAESTAFIDWNRVKLVPISDGSTDAHGIFRLPEDDKTTYLTATYDNNEWRLKDGAPTFSIEDYKTL